MLSAIIVDDEKNVCLLVQNLVNWGKMGINVVGTANDGKTAYNLILEYEPDIVITDIRMPGFSGVELIKNIQASGLSPSFIFISGYRNFEYAHKAIKYGVEEYLLKPIKKEALELALEKIKGKIENNHREREHHFIDDIIYNFQKSIDIISRDIKLNHKNRFKSGMTNVILLKIDSNNKKKEEVIESILEKIPKIISNLFNNMSSNILTYITYSGIICVINYPSDNDLSKNKYEALYKKVNEYIDLFGDLILTMGVGIPASNANKISESIETAINAVIARIRIGINRIIFAEDLNFINYNIADIFTLKRENVLKNAIETLNKDSIEHCLLDIFNEVKFKESLNPRIIIEISKNIMNLFILTVKKLGLEAKNERELRNFVSTGIDSSLSLDDIYNCLLQLIYEEIDIINNRKKDEENKPIREVKNYINNHYMERITLSELAEVVHLSSDYLSAVFKKEVGINFSGYLINYRLDKAKDLLVNTDMTIALISEKVGYTDRRYFSNLFRDKVGIKPSEYRKLYF